MTSQETRREICQFCSKAFSTLAKLNEHSKTAHSSKKPQMERERGGPGIEPADRKPTTELPPGAEEVKPNRQSLP
jgi:hypothetical protein